MQVIVAVYDLCIFQYDLNIWHVSADGYHSDAAEQCWDFARRLTDENAIRGQLQLI